jgi:hypothetical protein
MSTSVPNQPLSRARTALCWLYYIIAGVALVGTWRQNIAFMADRNVDFFTGFAAFWPALLANRATISITVDIFVFGLAAMVWMVLEARRLQLRGVWLYILFSFLIAISVTFPLFLAAREHRLAAMGASDTEPAASLGDKIGLALFGIGILIFTVYCTLR